MKFREVPIVDELYNEIRYNQKTTGVDLGVEKGTANMDKRNAAVLSVFSTMTTTHYSQAEREVDNKTPQNVLQKMFNNAERLIDHTFISDERGVLR